MTKAKALKSDIPSLLSTELNRQDGTSANITKVSGVDQMEAR